VVHPPKLGHIGQTINTRGFAYANRCTLQSLVARQCRAWGFGIVYCWQNLRRSCRGLFPLTVFAGRKREPTSRLKPLT